MERSPAFQFYPNDWLSSTVIATMTPAEEGAYIRLMCYAWNDEHCSIPDDDEVLAKLSRLGEGWFKGGSQMVRRCFVPDVNNPGRLVNKRLLKEREKQERWRAKSAEGGRKSAETRRYKAKGGSTTLEPQGQPNGNQEATLLSSSSNSNPIVPLSIEELVVVWNGLQEVRLVRDITSDRRKKLATRWKETAFREGWRDAMDKFPLKCFCEEGGWRPTIDWFLRPKQVTRILEGDFDWSKNGDAKKQKELPIEYAN